tara:strand:+ start:1384 stop:2232 length:849 start_codon:yes stop_codon:yes gene_type:complete
MNPRYPVYIISKGRSDSLTTARVFARLGVHFSIVVEPQEESLYADAIKAADVSEYATLRVLPFSNLGQGGIPARNWVWDDATESGARRHWIFDDNIGVFRRAYKNTIYPVADGTCFRVLEDLVDRYKNVPMAGLNYQNFVPKRSAMPPVYLNTRVYSMILLSNAETIRWRGRYNEDTDLSLRFLKDGKCTILMNAFFGDKAGTQTMKGGNTEELYEKTDNRREFAESLREQHPDVVRVVWKWGRWHHQVDYRPFRCNRLIRDPSVEVASGVNNYGLKLRTRI